MTSRLAPLRLQWSDHLMSNDLTQCEDPTLALQSTDVCNMFLTMGSHFSTSKPEPKWKSEAQFAMESSCFCVICGSPFDLEGEVYNLDTGAERYKVNTASLTAFICLRLSVDAKLPPHW